MDVIVRGLITQPASTDGTMTDDGGRTGRRRSLAKPAMAIGLTAAAVVTAVTGGGVAAWRPPGRQLSAGTHVNQPVRQVAVGQPALAFHGIIELDYLVITPQSVVADQISRLGALPGVRAVTTADAGRLTLDGSPANTLGIDPGQFRSWMPLVSATDDPLWQQVDRGNYVAAATTAGRLGLSIGARSVFGPITGNDLTLGGTASLGVPGIDVLVNQQVGRRLGLQSARAVLISAPGGDSSLSGKIGQILGAAPYDLRQQATGGQSAGQSGGKTIGKVPAGKARNYLDLYRQAAQRCPGLSWTVLAAIGQVESDHGRNMGPSTAGALGPMQFMPATWKVYGVDGDDDGVANIMDPFDAVPAAADLLCANGANRGSAGLHAAIFAYNHAEWYVQEVLSLAAAYGREYPT